MAVKRGSTSRPGLAASPAPPSTPSAASTESAASEADAELAVSAALILHRPRGSSRHLQVAVVADKLQQAGLKSVTPSSVWALLTSTVGAIEETRSKEEASFVEFKLPRKEYGSIMNEMKRGSGNGATRSRSNARISLQNSPQTPIAKSDEAVDNGNSASSKTKSVVGEGSAGETPKSGKRPTRSAPASSSSAKRRK